jgi:hypothetical protein
MNAFEILASLRSGCRWSFGRSAAGRLRGGTGGTKSWHPSQCSGFQRCIDEAVVNPSDKKAAR